MGGGNLNAAFGEGTVLLYDSGIVAAGAAFSTPILDVRRFGALALASNNADASPRNLNFSLYVPGNLTTIGTGLFVAVASGNIWQINAWGGGFATGSTFATFPPGFIGFTVAAGGATTARLIIWGR